MTKKPPKEGLHIEYHENGNKKLEYNYENYKLHGEYSIFNEEGQKTQAGVYERGTLDKYAIYGYHANGNLSFEENLINVDLDDWKGEWRNGKIITWHENGQKQTESNYVEDVLVGKYTKWHQNGQKKSEYIENSSGKYWFENGQKKCEFIYSDNDEIIRIEWHKNGQKKSKCYLKSVKPKNSNTELQNQGLSIEWHHNGQKESVGGYIKGSKEGNWIYYHDNGQKASEGTYKIFTDGGWQSSLELDEWNYWYKNGNKKTKTIYAPEHPKHGPRLLKSSEWYENGLKSNIKKYEKGKVLSWDSWDEDGNVLDTKERLDAENRPPTSRTHTSNNDIDWLDQQSLTDDEKLLGESFWKDIL